MNDPSSRAIRQVRLNVVLTTTLIACACGGAEPGAPVAPPSPAALTVAPTTLDDTIGATFSTPITVRVMRGTVPQVGLAVRMTVAGAGSLASLSASANGPANAALSTTTDATGATNVFATFAMTAGSGAIAVDVPVLGLSDTVRFVVRAGKVAQLSVLPRDTTVFVGKPLKLRVTLRDRGGNPVTDRYDVSGISGLTPTAASDVFVAGPEIARGFVALKSSQVTDSVAVSVVPIDTMLFTFWTLAYGGPIRLASAGLDGTIARTFGPQTHEGPFLFPGWSADGSRVVANYGGTYGDGDVVARMYLYDTTTARTELAAFIPGMNGRLDPRFTRAGDWIYFHSLAADYSTGVWRIRPDGSALQSLLARPLGQYIYGLYPFPDGRSVLVSIDHFSGQHGYRFDVTTRGLQDLGAMDHPVSVSPDGTQLAWVGGSDGILRIRDVSGGTPRLVAPGMGSIAVPPAWTRDGRYVVIASYVVNVATGTKVQLPWIVASPKTLSVRDPTARP
jgi:hypothetical protein